MSESVIRATQQRAVTDSVPRNMHLPLFWVALCCDSSDHPVRKQATAACGVARRTGCRSPRSPELGTSWLECVDDGDGDEEDDKESNIYLTFTVCQALCRALHNIPGSGCCHHPPYFTNDEVRP